MFQVLLLVSSFLAAPVFAGYAVPTVGYSSVRSSKQPTYYFWGDAHSFHRSVFKPNSLLSLDNLLEDRTQTITRKTYDERLLELARRLRPEDAHTLKIIAFFTDQISLHKKVLASPAITPEEKARLEAILKDLEERRTFNERRTVKWLIEKLNKVVLTPKEVILISETAIDPHLKYSSHMLKWIFDYAIEDTRPSIAKAEALFKSLQDRGFLPACEYVNYTTTNLSDDSYDDYGSVPSALKRGMTDIRIKAVAPERHALSQLKSLCEGEGLKNIYVWDLFDDHGTHVTEDYTGEKTCQVLMDSQIGKSLEKLSKTGSHIAGVEHVVWLPLSGMGAYQGPNYPRVSKTVPARPEAMFLTPNGDKCHVNPPSQKMDPKWELNIICKAESITSYGWLKTSDFSISCTEVFR